MCFGVVWGVLGWFGVFPRTHQKALYTGKHFYLLKSTEKTHARRGLYAMWITILCVLDNKDA